MKKIVYISGTRADYGLMRQTLYCINEKKDLSLEIIATGMHLMREFGETAHEIREDGFTVHEIPAKYRHDDQKSMALFVGIFTQFLTKKLSLMRPDIILLMGDRAEMLVGAIVGVYLSIPIAHIHGGERSGTVDNIVRHAITKLAQIHLTATKDARDRIIKMGENPRRVFWVGAPGVDTIVQMKSISRKTIMKKYNLNSQEPYFILVQHPISEEISDAAEQMKLTLDALVSLRYQGIITYPNADAGGRAMISVIKKYHHYPFLHIYKSIPHNDYINLMKYSAVFVGNSSAGIIEAPSLGIPSINIGRRQIDRERGNGVVTVFYDKEAIEEAIEKAVRRAFSQKEKHARGSIYSPYKKSGTSKKIAQILSNSTIDKKEFVKKITY